MGKFYKTIIFITISLILLTVESSNSRERCGKNALITKPTFVYFSIPKISSNRGLIGKKIALLPPGVKIKICRIQYVKIGFSKFPFFRIMFMSKRNMRYGWIAPRTFIYSNVQRNSVVFIVGLQESVMDSSVKPKQIDEEKFSVIDLPDASSLLWNVYVLLFSSVLFGMIGKTFFMYAENRFTTKELLTRFGLTFFLAPIAFGGVLQLDIEITGQKELFQQMVNAISIGFGFSSITSFKHNKTNIKV